MSSFTKELYAKLVSPEFKRPDVIDFVYNTIDDMLLTNKFREVDIILTELEINKLPKSITLSILTITLPWRDQIPTRYDFYNDAEAYFLTTETSEKATAILVGLK